MHRFKVAQLPATPWKNGGGLTREIVSMPRGAGLDAFSWRVSIADVSSDGPFSIFDGVDRVLILLDGNGVELRADDGRVVRRLDEPFVPFAFSGGDRITSALIDGSSVDFNVMTRRGVTQADVRVIRRREELPECNSGVLFAARGQLTVQSASFDEMRFDAGDGCWWDAETVEWHVIPDSSDAVLISVGLQRSTVIIVGRASPQGHQIPLPVALTVRPLFGNHP